VRDHRTVRQALAAPVAVVAMAFLAACGVSAGAGSASPDDADAAGAPTLADARVLDDPRTWDGPSSAVVGDAAVAPVAADPTPELPVTVTDAQGTRITIDDASRILALDVYGTLARTVFDLGLGDRVVGRDVSTQFDEAADLPLVTRSGHDLSAEAILELDPTVVLTDTTLGPWDVLLQVRDAGVPVVVLDSHRGLDNVRELTVQVADALGVHQAGEQLAGRTERAVADVRAQIAQVAPSEESRKLRMALLYVRGQAGVYYLFGEGSGADGLIDALGGYDVAREIGWDGMKPVTDEGIIAAQPDVVLMMTKGLESAGGVDGLLERLPALATTPAGEHRRFVDMADSQLLGFGPLTADVLNALAVAVYAPASAS
jgi:iron complex transport system substrate-binding protein